MNTDKDYDALTHWADHHMNLTKNSTTTARGYVAASIGRDLLERVGRPALDPDAELGTASPRHQVRLPRPLREQVDEIAERQGRKPAAVMRDAIADYVRTHDKDAPA